MLSLVDSAPPPFPHCERLAAFAAALDQLERTLASDVCPPGVDPEAVDPALFAAAQAAELALRLHPRDRTDAAVRRAVRLAARLSALHPMPPPPSPPARGEAASGWSALLATMLARPAHAGPPAPLLREVPDDWWGDYTAWLFATAGAPPSSVDRPTYAQHLLRHLDELTHWLDRNRGSAAVRAAAEAFLEHAAFDRRLVRDHPALAAARSAVLQRLLAGADLAPAFEPLLLPRLGRPLRVGVIVRHWEPGAAAYTALARSEHLPAGEFECVPFALRSTASPLEAFVRSRTPEFHVLDSGDAATDLERLRGAALDVALFVGDLAGAPDPFTRLALSRVAALQLVWDDDGRSTPSPENDLALGSAEPLARGGRPAHLGGAAFAYALESIADEAELTYARADLGLAADGCLFVAFLSAPPDVDTLSRWVELLRRSPAAQLLLYLPPDPAPAAGTAETLCHNLQAALATTGVAPARASVLAPDCATHAESRAVLRLADVVLADLAHDTPLWAAEVARAGLPRARTDSPGGFAEALRLAVDPAARAAEQDRRRELAAVGIDSTDTLAAGDALADLLRTAFDELELVGRPAFRAAPEPLNPPPAEPLAPLLETAEQALAIDDGFTAAEQARRALRHDPRHPVARRLLGRALLLEGQPARAVDYLLAAVQAAPVGAAAWFELAGALRANAQPADALRALETSLRLDARQPEAWLLMIELAEAIGATDIAREALQALDQIDPAHPRRDEFADRLV